MWKPPQRIKYTAVPGSWPTAVEAKNSLLFSPLQVGNLKLAQRTWVPAMVPWRANENGEVTTDVLQWYHRFALGQPGAIVVEATGIRDVPSGPLLRIGDDRYLPGLQKLVKTVREASGGETRLFIQLIDFLSIRRRPAPEKYFQHYLTITDSHREKLRSLCNSDQAIRDHLQSAPKDSLLDLLTPAELEGLEFGHRERVTDTQHKHIRDLPNTLPALFAAAAKRARAAGFDGVELHYAHAYTLASFLSATNHRQDGYGGCRENRIRLPLETYRAVRKQVGKNYIVGCRFLSEECIEGGSQLDDAGYFAVQFAKAGMDFLSLSRGGKFDDARQPKVGWAAYPYTGPSGYECMPQYLSDKQGPFGRNVEPTHYIRKQIRSHGLQTPVVVAGGIFDFSTAEALLENKRADIIGFARQALADPDWFCKVKSGCGHQVRLCRYSNYCEGLDQKHKQVTCELWDREDLDAAGIRKSVDGKRRLVPPLWNKEWNKKWNKEWNKK